MLDGLKSQVVQVDAVQDDGDVGSDTNFYGNGFYNKKTLYKTPTESVSDYDGKTGRMWSIENPNKQHPYSGANVGYKLGEFIISAMNCYAYSLLEHVSSLSIYAPSSRQTWVHRMESSAIRKA